MCMQRWLLTLHVADKSIAQIALRWLLEKDTVSSVVIGVKSISQLEDNCVAGMGWRLTRDEVCVLLDSVDCDHFCAGNHRYGDELLSTFEVY